MLHLIVVALYANSALVNNGWSSMMSRRAEIWETTAPLRTDLSDVFYEPNAKFSDYVQWSLKAPMLFIHREGQYVDCSGVRFEDFMRDGFSSHHATIGDYALHLSTLFPDVRLKKFIEIRGADMGDRSQVLSLPALFKGLFYHEAALDALDELFESVDATAARSAAKQAARHGLSGTLMSRPLLEWAERVLEIASEGIQALEPSALCHLEALLPSARLRQQRALDAEMTPSALLEATGLLP